MACSRARGRSTRTGLLVAEPCLGSSRQAFSPDPSVTVRGVPRETSQDASVERWPSPNPDIPPPARALPHRCSSPSPPHFGRRAGRRRPLRRHRGDDSIPWRGEARAVVRADRDAVAAHQMRIQGNPTTREALPSMPSGTSPRSPVRTALPQVEDLAASTVVVRPAIRDGTRAAQPDTRTGERSGMRWPDLGRRQVAHLRKGDAPILGPALAEIEPTDETGGQPVARPARSDERGAEARPPTQGRLRPSVDAEHNPRCRRRGRA